MQYKKFHVHKYKCFGYYEEPIKHEYLILWFKCEICGKKKTKGFPIDPMLHLFNKDKENQ